MKVRKVQLTQGCKVKVSKVVPVKNGGNPDKLLEFCATDLALASCVGRAPSLNTTREVCSHEYIRGNVRGQG